jgi:phenylpropionate dioxygenase-like ring-hydroxylating dioxygenase large terminal subunit
MNAPENPVFSNMAEFVSLPIGEFFTPEYYLLEKERIFKKSWLRIDPETRIPNIGDYFVKELESCDTSVIIVRGRDNRIRAFHNMCAHRSNRVAYEPSGNTTSFNCSYHSWSFGLDGSLRALPEEHLFPGLDKKEYGLTEVACETWESFIFINVDPQPEQTLREYLGEDVYNGYGGFFKKFEQVGRISATVPVNWKIFLNAFVETYHFSTVHTPTAGDIVNSREFPNGKIDAVRLYGKHCIVSATSNSQRTPTFTEGLARKYSGGATLAADPTKKMSNPPQINPKNLPDWLTDILIIFPMCDLQAFQGFYITLNFWPISHDQTKWDVSIHMIPPKNAAEEVCAEFNRAHSREVVREDLKNMQMVQSNLSSRAKSHQVFGMNEPMVLHTYKVVSEQVGSGW